MEEMCFFTCKFISICIFFLIIPVRHCSHYVKGTGDHCYSSSSEEKCVSSFEKRYLLYDVNPPEGFNLRRDVFMRIAVLTKKLQKFGDWTLVLPPWTSLYHWKSTDVGDQFNLPWGTFFDVKSIEKFVPVIELHDFMEDENNIIDVVYVLQHFKDAWENNDWKDKMNVEPCHQRLHYWLKDDGLYEGDFWDNSDLVSAKKVQCLSFQGSASYIIPILVGGSKVGKKGWITEPRPDSARTVMLDRAEVLLHDEFGSVEYWRARRSMRFASLLVQEGTKFRQQFLNSSDEQDDTLIPEDWRDEKRQDHTDGEKGEGIIFSKGGPYLCLHLRRQDFLWGRSAEVPSLKWAAFQVLNHLKRLELPTVFLATDAPDKEVEEFRQHIGPNYNVVQWKPSSEQKKVYKDGGIAIIEQIICRHARYFIGTHESTYSFRIQEEREIMGFHPDSTFNCLCGGDVPVAGKEPQCEKPSRWRIVF